MNEKDESLLLQPSTDLAQASEPRHALGTSTPSKRRLTTFLLSLTLILTYFHSNTQEVSIGSIGSTLEWWKYQITPLPKDPLKRARKLLRWYPIIDMHIDLPILTRAFYANQLAEIDLTKSFKGQVDIPRLRQGQVGGFFWSAYYMCPEDAGYENQNESNFTDSTWTVRDTLEQIDIARLTIEKHSDTFEFAPTAAAWRKAISKGKIASIIGIEGGHQLGSTLSTLRTYFALGARYVTLTHTCNNALADSCGMQGTPIKPRWGGLSPFGRTAIKEMNRLGMIIDLSHTAPSTASDALSLSLAPLIFSHSNARGLHNVVRNVPDSILRRIGRLSKSHASVSYHGTRKELDLSRDGEGGMGWGNDTGEAEKDIPGGDVLISLNFSPDFISEWADGSGERANIKNLADHADYIGRLAGREHIGIGSDFDGIPKVPEGLEDVSKYPYLIAELISRGWSDKEIAGLTGENLLRVMSQVEDVAAKLQAAETLPETEIFSGRTDMKRRDHF